MQSKVKIFNPAASEPDPPPTIRPTWDAVVLVHGLFATKRSMLSASHFLEKLGYFVVNWGYPTRLKTVKQHAEALLPLLRRMSRDPNLRRIHFVAHSFGGIVVRYALQQEPIEQVHRMVMLAPPNQGSPWAKFSVGIWDRLFPALRDIRESPGSLIHELTSTDLEVGVIAAERDFVVGQRNTHLDSQRDHCVVPTSHFKLPRCSLALEHAANFLAHGHFAFEEPQARAA